MQEQLTVEHIISEEIKEYKRIEKTSSETITNLVLIAGAKLEKSGVVETNEISRVLCKKFNNHVRLIHRISPEKWKLKTRPNENEIPKSLTQEYFYLLNELYADRANIAGKIYKIFKNDSSLEKDSTVLSSDVEEIKAQIAENQTIKNMIDKREKLHTWNKIIVRKKSLEDTLHHVAQEFDQSAKWIKHINEDKDLDRIMKEINECPKCHWRIADWFDVQSERVRRGLPVQDP